jgi:hypothetical protein
MIKSIIPPIANPTEIPSALSNLEIMDYERWITVVGKSLDIQQRKEYASKTFRLVCWWLGGLFLLLFLNGFKFSWLMFQLSDTILLAIISGTTVNILGIYIVVINYLFPKRKE